MFKIALPILGVSKSAVAEAFYRGQMGFRLEHAYRPNPERQDSCWMGTVRDGAHLVLSSFECGGPLGSRGVQIYVENAAALQREFRDAGVAAPEELMDQTWGQPGVQLGGPRWQSDHHRAGHGQRLMRASRITKAERPAEVAYLAELRAELGH